MIYSFEGVEVDTFTQEMDDVDRAILDGETEGFVRVHVRKGTDEIVGATIVASPPGWPRPTWPLPLARLKET